jgi:hypothetical protein
MDVAGTQVYFWIIALIHAVLVGLVLLRMSVSSSVPVLAQGPFVAVPEVGTAVAATLNPESAWDEEDDDTDQQATLFEDNPYLQMPAAAQD